MTDAVARLTAALEGRYTIERELGEGGMATVYLADDLKHERKVALKVLKPELAAVVGAERFLAEIKTTANLQHPHILPLHDSGDADSFLFYVMPYVEGETLRERIDREKQLAVKDSVAITQKVADALDYAHEHGVVHRDIKPGNILLSERGELLIADFGIALAVAQAGAGRITETGLSLGTPHYMSPEQATGDRDVDPRSDVYALGCVLYEMLAGEPPFSAPTAQAVLVSILTADAPSITSVRRTVSSHVDSALAQALEKLPADRFASAAEFGAALGDEGFTYQAKTPTSVTTPMVEDPAAPIAEPSSWTWLRDPPSLVAALAILLAVWGWSRPFPTTSQDSVPFRMGLTDFEIRAPDGSGNRLAISRDASHIAVVSDVDGVRKIFLRRSDQREFQEIPGTEGGYFPTFSPNGEWLAFYNETGIMRVEVSGGPILPVAQGNSPHWGLDETIVFTGPGGGIYQVLPSGGDPVFIAEEGAPLIARPHLLPDGKAVLFQGEVDGVGTLMLVEIESGDVISLGFAGFNPRYVPTGHIVYGHESQTLMAAPFDLATHQVTGEAGTALPGVLVYGGGATQFAVSETGTAVYGLPAAGGVGACRLVILDLDGVETLVPLPEGDFNNPRFSPDGRYIAYEADTQIWVYDQETGATSPLTTEGVNQHPTWSSDGRYVYFASLRAGTLSYDGFRRVADGSADVEPVFRRDQRNHPISASPDGSEWLVSERTLDRGMDLLIATEGPDSVELRAYLRAPWNETYGGVSPDGRRVLYMADEEGGEIYVRSFPDALNQVRVADGIGTGGEPIWAPDASAIYFRDAGQVMRVTVIAGDEFGVGPAESLFEDRWLLNTSPLPSVSWDVSPDGARFVFVRGQGGEMAGGDGGPPVIPIEMVVNWFEELRERVGN